jgi:preprotein translocase subunit Sec63
MMSMSVLLVGCAVLTGTKVNVRRGLALHAQTTQRFLTKKEGVGSKKNLIRRAWPLQILCRLFQLPPMARAHTTNFLTPRAR